MRLRQRRRDVCATCIRRANAPLSQHDDYARQASGKEPPRVARPRMNGRVFAGDYAIIQETVTPRSEAGLGYVE